MTVFPGAPDSGRAPEDFVAHLRSGFHIQRFRYRFIILGIRCGGWIESRLAPAIRAGIDDHAI